MTPVVGFVYDWKLHVLRQQGAVQYGRVLRGMGCHLRWFVGLLPPTMVWRDLLCQYQARKQ